MKFLLINPNFSNTTTDVPLGLAYIAAVAKNAECDVKVVDADAIKASNTDNDILGTVEDYKPDIIGVSIYTDFAKRAYKLLKTLSLIQVPVVVGGPHPTVVPEEPFNFGAKFVVRGEGEISFSRLIEHIREERSVNTIPGLSYCNGNKIIHNDLMRLIKDLDCIPFPAKELFNRANYSGQMDAEPFGNILSSRGCPSLCVYCSNMVMGRRYRFRNPSNVIEEIKYLKNRFGINRFTFSDDTFTANAARVEETCHQILENELNIQWSCFSRINSVNENILSMMKKAGCFLINFGIEHGDDNSFKILKKGITLNTIKKSLSLTKEAEIRYRTNYILGFPWETEESIQATLKHVLEFNDSGYQVSPIVPYPGTEIYEKYKDEYRLENWWLKRDGIKWQDTMRIARGHKLSKFSFFRLEHSKERMIEAALEKIYSFHMKFGKDRQKFFSMRWYLYWFFYISYKISPAFERKLGSAVLKVTRWFQEISSEEKIKVTH